MYFSCEGQTNIQLAFHRPGSLGCDCKSCVVMFRQKLWELCGNEYLILLTPIPYLHILHKIIIILTYYQLQEIGEGCGCLISTSGFDKSHLFLAGSKRGRYVRGHSRHSQRCLIVLTGKWSRIYGYISKCIVMARKKNLGPRYRN